ncbi:MAG: hypothetical protein PUA96_05105, partial [Bacteroidales bacterium]|nr:hypothetical protein [Bacteroidales bacterium]
MKKLSYIISSIAAVAVIASCSKQFDVPSTSYLTGSNAAQMVENDPEYLSSYVQGLYAYMVQFG